MTGGFNTNVRGIQIDITQTLNKFLNQNKEVYSKKEFEDYLKSIGLDSEFQENTGQKHPINEGFVVSFDFDEGDGQDASGILATGLWQYQNWVLQQWSKEDLLTQGEFNNPKYLDIKIENQLRNLWKDKLILTGKFAINSIGCEWSNSYFPKTQKGGALSYYHKYIKYKTKYINLKNNF